MILQIIENDNPAPPPHQVVVDVLFQLRRSYQITIHQCGNGFFHIKQATKKGTKVIGFACDQLMGIDKAFSFIGIQPPIRLKGMIERRYWQLKELKEVVYG